MQLAQGREVLAQHRLERGDGSLGVGRPGGAGVKGGDPAADRRDLVRPRRAGVEPARERGVLVVASHFDRVLDGAWRVLGRQPHAAVGADERPHAEVDLGREAAVQPHLLAAQMVPALERAVVEEREPDGLLELVRPVAL